jgi:hypothetical protein
LDRLVEIRQNFNAAVVRMKALATFDAYQRNNERFILYLYENYPVVLQHGRCKRIFACAFSKLCMGLACAE